MKDQFNLTRFGRLFRKHTAEHGKGYLMSVGVLLGLLSLLMGAQAYLQVAPVRPAEQLGYLGFFLLMGGAIFTSTVFANLADKKQAIAALTLPASHLEKYLVGWVYSFVLFTLACIGCFYLVASVVVSLDNWQGQPARLLNFFDPEYHAATLVWGYAFVHAVVIWGAVYFERLHLVKTGFVFFATLALVLLLNYQLVKLLIDHISSPMVIPFGSVDLGIGKEHYQLDLPESAQRVVSVVPVLLGLLLWVAGYFRVQEKEI